METRRLYPLTRFARANSLADQVAHILLHWLVMQKEG